MESIENSEIKTLEELTSENCCILLDNSIINPLGKGRKNMDFDEIKEKADFTEENNKFLSELTESIINKRNIFTTNYILEEIGNCNHYNYVKIIKKNGSCENRELLRLRRMIKKEEQGKRKLINSFVENNKVAIFEGETKKLYEEIFKKYQQFTWEYNLSNTNLDFLATGITFSMTSGPVIFMSNNYKLLYARNRILKTENLKEQDARFFTRIDFFKFNHLFYHKNKQLLDSY